MNNIAEELEYIRNKNDGILKAIDVVEFAQNENTQLHLCFEWDNSKAAHEYRLWQARELIVRVTVSNPKKELETIQMYVSLPEDRKQKDGGYRNIIQVLSDKEYREQLLKQAMKDFEYFEQKYKMLEELLELFKIGKKIKKLIVT